MATQAHPMRTRPSQSRKPLGQEPQPVTPRASMATASTTQTRRRRSRRARHDWSSPPDSQMTTMTKPKPEAQDQCRARADAVEAGPLPARRHDQQQGERGKRFDGGIKQGGQQDRQQQQGGDDTLSKHVDRRPPPAEARPGRPARSSDRSGVRGWRTPATRGPARQDQSLATGIR